MQAIDFLMHVRVRADLEDNEQAQRATEAVFQTLRDRILHETGDNIAAQFPSEIKPLWESGFIEHLAQAMSGPERFDMSEFLARVAEWYGTNDMNRARSITRAVFTTMRQAITPGAQKEVEKELPGDIREFWLQSIPPDMPEEAPATRRQREEHERAEHERMMAAPTDEEQVGARPWGPETDLPSGADIEGVEQVEIRGREMRVEQGRPRPEAGGVGQPMETEPQLVGEDFEEEEEPEARPPAEDRIQKMSPPSARAAVTGPGSVTHYRSDPQVLEEIRQMLAESEEIDEDDIDVFVQAGNVTLRGTAASEHERDTAGKVAAKVLGVGEILNEIEVEEE